MELIHGIWTAFLFTISTAALTLAVEIAVPGIWAAAWTLVREVASIERAFWQMVREEVF